MATAAIPQFITVQYGVSTGDHQGQVQYTAAADVPIIGRFKSGARSGDYPAAAPISIRIGNVEDGAGTARITSPSDYTVKAGSKDNTIKIQFTAAGTMTGGSVRLHTPTTWGALQETDSAAANHIRVSASRSMVDQAEISYGTRYVLVPLLTVGKNSHIEFVLSNALAQKEIGLAEFRIESAGGPSGSLRQLKGIERPDDDEDSTIKETDPYMLRGHVYETGVAPTDDDLDLDRNGLMRLEVVAGEGGTGEAVLESIVRTDAGLRELPQ